jgi:hypothetical protein
VPVTALLITRLLVAGTFLHDRKITAPEGGGKLSLPIITIIEAFTRYYQIFVGIIQDVSAGNRWGFARLFMV